MNTYFASLSNTIDSKREDIADTANLETAERERSNNSDYRKKKNRRDLTWR